MAKETKDKGDNQEQLENSDQGEPPASAEPASELEQLRQKLEETQKSAEAFKDQFLRKAAEFENFKRRTEADFLNLIRNANEGLITSLLPIVNDIVRSLKSGQETKDFDSFFKGVELIHSKLMKLLEQQGLTPFESIGKPFDVEYHDALLQIPKDDVPANTIIEEVEPGYMLNDKVLHHAKVIVSAAPEPRADSESVEKNKDVEET